MWGFVDGATGMDAYKLQGAELHEPAEVYLDPLPAAGPGPGGPGGGGGHGGGGHGHSDEFDLMGDMMRCHKKARTTQVRYEQERSARARSLVQEWVE
eukprot:5990151-Pyramimonas_sp.AAC.1